MKTSKYYYGVDAHSVEYDTPDELWKWLHSHGFSFYAWAMEFNKLLVAALQVGDLDTVDECVQFLKDVAELYRREWAR